MVNNLFFVAPNCFGDKEKNSVEHYNEEYVEYKLDIASKRVVYAAQNYIRYKSCSAYADNG